MAMLTGYVSTLIGELRGRGMYVPLVPAFLYFYALEHRQMLDYIPVPPGPAVGGDLLRFQIGYEARH